MSAQLWPSSQLFEGCYIWAKPIEEACERLLFLSNMSSRANARAQLKYLWYLDIWSRLHSNRKARLFCWTTSQNFRQTFLKNSFLFQEQEILRGKRVVCCNEEPPFPPSHAEQRVEFLSLVLHCLTCHPADLNLPGEVNRQSDGERSVVTGHWPNDQNCFWGAQGWNGCFDGTKTVKGLGAASRRTRKQQERLTTNQYCTRETARAVLHEQYKVKLLPATHLHNNLANS